MSGITLDESLEFYDKDNATWVKVIDLALVADGASSQGAQTLSINVTELPEGGANYRVYKTTANGQDFLAPAQALALGDNIITVAGVAFDRSVKVQFSSAAIRFNTLSVNGAQLYPEPTAPVEPQPGITVGESSAFAPTSNTSWTRVISLALVADGASSQGDQTMSMNITQLPEAGASYRVYKTTANGSDFFGSAQDLVLGENTITVAGVAFDRSVKVQFSSADVRFDVLSVNGAQLYPSEDSWDFDKDGNADALTDGLLLLRYTFNLKGDSLTSGAISAGSTLTATQVEANVAASTATFADIDGSGNVDALTDGLLLLRYMFNLKGDSLIDGAISDSAGRTSAVDIESYILSLYP